VEGQPFGTNANPVASRLKLNHIGRMLKLLDFPFLPFDAQASIQVLAAPYLFWPARADDGTDINVYIRLSALEDVLGIVGDRPGRDLSDVVRASLLHHRERIEGAANGLYEPGGSDKIFLEAPDFREIISPWSSD